MLNTYLYLICFWWFISSRVKELSETKFRACRSCEATDTKVRDEEGGGGSVPLYLLKED